MAGFAVEHLYACAQGATQLREEHGFSEGTAADGAAYEVAMLVKD